MSETTIRTSAGDTPFADILGASIEACSALGRDDLLQRLRSAKVRMQRPSTLVCIVGEYKQGKSLLLNALVGQEVCPVDDDAATTAFMTVSATDQESARVRRTVDGDAIVQQVPIDDVWRYVSERGQTEDRDGVELVEVGIATDVLPPGLVLLDTPGVGGLLDRQAATTLRYLQLADAAMFVTDASQELTRPEVEFLRHARAVCSEVVFVVTKIDLYPAWPAIVELDRGHLAAADLPFEPIPVSAATFNEARRREDVDLEAESNIAGLRRLLVDDVMADAEQRAGEHAVAEAGWALHRLRDPIATDVALATDPSQVSDAVARLGEAEHRLLALQAAGARWSTVLNDNVTDLRGDVDHRLRAGVRDVLTELDERLEGIDPGECWEELSESIRTQVAALIDEVFTEIVTQADELSRQIAELLDEDVPLALGLDRADGPAVDEYWNSSDRGLTERRTGVVTTGFTALRGGSSGTIVFGMLARFAGIAMATPASIGVAVVFGAKQVIDARKQAVAHRRQEARTVIRRFVDEVSLEAGNRARRLVQHVHRTLRDAYTIRLQELSRSASESLTSARAVASADAQGRSERLKRTRGWLDHIDALIARLPDEGAP